MILFSVAIAAVAALVFARRPDVPAATALVIVAAGAAGSSVPWFLGTHDERSRRWAARSCSTRC